MAKKNKKEKLTKRIIAIIILILVLVLIASSISNSNKIKNKKNENKSVEIIEETPLDSITIEDLTKKLKTSEDFIVYIGYEGCDACENYAPVLKRGQALLNYKAYYLNYKEVNKSSKVWKNFLEKITIKQTLNVQLDEGLTKIEDKIGNIIKKYGYTPVTIHISNGKVLNAHIGSLSSKEIEEFLK